jgi:hypothetical protein
MRGSLNLGTEFAYPRMRAFQLNKNVVSIRVANVFTRVFWADSQAVVPVLISTSACPLSEISRRRKELRVYITRSGCSCGSGFVVAGSNVIETH